MNPDKITNRHIAKLLANLGFLNMPEMAQREVIRQMHFLKKDLMSINKETRKQIANEEINYNR